MNDYHRRVLDYLREEYGVNLGTNDIHDGSKHSYLEFAYAGKPHRLTLHRNITVETNAINMKLQDIRRELGPPLPAQVNKPKRRMEDMMPEPFNPLPLPIYVAAATPKEASGHGTVSNLQSNRCLYFMLPPEVSACLDKTIKYGVTRAGDDSWEIAPGGRGSVRSAGREGRYQISASSGTSGLAGDLGYFSGYPAHYVVADGHVLVSLIERKSVSPIKRKASYRDKVEFNIARNVGFKPVASVANVDPIAPAPMIVEVLPITMTSPIDRMLALLSELKKIEAAGPHRLIKTKDGKWKFQAPSIQLEDENE